MPDDNGRLRNIEEWIRTLDSKSDLILERMTTLAPLSKVEQIEKRTRHLEVKVAGIAAGATTVGLYLKSLFT